MYIAKVKVSSLVPLFRKDRICLCGVRQKRNVVLVEVFRFWQQLFASGRFLILLNLPLKPGFRYVLKAGETVPKKEIMRQINIILHPLRVR